MKWALILWIAPLAMLGSWYGLSYYDVNFGFFMLTRQAHDLVFQIYGHILGLPPADIPPLIAKALVFDTTIVMLIPLWRQRKKIRAFLEARFARPQEERPLPSEESLSSAP